MLRSVSGSRLYRWLALGAVGLSLAACAGAPATPTPAPAPPPTVAPTATVAAPAAKPTDAAKPAEATKPVDAIKPAAPAAADATKPAATAATGAGGSLQPCAAAATLSAIQTPVPGAPSPAAAAKPTPAGTPPPTPTPRPAPAEDRVGYPEGYQNSFKLLLVMDRPDNKQVRVICGNDAAAAAQPGQPYPHGSILVMETYRARQDAAGNVVKDANGRYIREALAGIFIMRKEPGFGAAYEQDRSGEWEYVAYRPDKSYLTMPRNTNACAACHLNQAGQGQDYVFRTGRFRAPIAATPAPPPANEVVIDLYAFHPASLTIKVGTTVKWVNGDEAEHAILARNNAFKSEVLKTKAVRPGESFSYTFTQPGTYEYICSIHPAMTARIEVTS